MKEYPLKYASTDKNKKSHYNSMLHFLWPILDLRPTFITELLTFGSDVRTVS